MTEQVRSPELEELDRVLASPEFRSSRRGQRMLRYLVEHTLNGDHDRLKERSVGFELFGRDADYDTGRDSIVRVAANDVRKRLAEYYANETGSASSVKIQLPAGSYVPVFRKVEPVASEVLLNPLQTTEPRISLSTTNTEPAALSGRASRPWWQSIVLLIALAAVSVSVVLWLRPAPARSGRNGLSGPTADTFWQQVFGNGRPTAVVLSDSNLTMFEEMIGRNVTLQEYAQKRLRELVDAEFKSPEAKSFAELLMRPPSTSMADAGTSRAFGEINGKHAITTDLIFARDFGTSYFDSHNVVLLGSLRANPWVGLFEKQMNFQSGIAEAPVRTWFDNRAPRDGELRRYDGIWNREGYCRVAFLPNVKRNGNVLILSGTGLSTTAAGSEFVTSEEWLRKFRDIMGPAMRDQFPHFEVLLRVDLVAAVPVKFEIVGWRTY